MTRYGKIWRRVSLIGLVLVNVATAAFVVVDLRRRLAAAQMPQGASEVLPTPTMVPPPTSVPATRPDPDPTMPPATVPLEWPHRAFPSTLIADDRFAYADLYAAEIQDFLEGQDSALARISLSVGPEEEDAFAHALSGHCIRYGLNPKVLLALLEVQSGAVRRADLSKEELNWAFGYEDPQWEGLDLQVQWATFLLADGFRGEEQGEMPLLTDGTLAPIPGEANAATQSLLRLLAYTTDAAGFARLRSDGAGSFVATYRDLFQEDPRMPLELSWEPTRQPFLWPPFSGAAPISARFDHEYPIFRENGSLVSYSGDRGQQSYDGHDGWDYVLPAGSPVLAAAAGRVVFAGMLDTLCPTPAGLVVIDHGRGYRSLYLHLQRIDVEEGQSLERGERVGTVGSTGCSSGPHLHFGVQFLGRDTDPYGWCGSATMPVDPWSIHPAGVASRWLWADHPSPCPVPAEAVVVDDGDERFGQSPALWYEAPVGYGDHAFWAVAVEEAQESTHRVVWRPEIPSTGRYFLYAFIPWYDTGRPDSSKARYRIRHAGGETTVTVDQALSAGMWAPLGTFSFFEGSKGYVYLDDVTADAGTTVWFDVIVWVRE